MKRKLTFNKKALLYWVLAIGGIIVFSKLWVLIPFKAKTTINTVMSALLVIMVGYLFIETVFIKWIYEEKE